MLTGSEEQAAEGGDGDKDGADGVQAQSEPAGGGEEQEPGLCTQPGPEEATISKLNTSTVRRNWKQRRLTRVQVLVGVKDFLEPLLGSEGPDRPQALERRRQVGEDGTAGCTEEDAG